MKIAFNDKLEHIEKHLANKAYQEALKELELLRSELIARQEKELKTSESIQYFCFRSDLEKMLYSRVEKDPRQLVMVSEAYDKLYTQLAYCYLMLEDKQKAKDALAQAIRWNPMNCSYRLNLAQLMLEDAQESEALSLAYSVFERAQKPKELVLAYLMFARVFMQAEKLSTAGAILKAAHKLDPQYPPLQEALYALRAAGTEALELDDELAEELLDEQGLPEGANLAVVIGILIAADQAALEGNKEHEQAYFEQAAQLVGEKNAQVLSQIIKEEA